MKKIVAILFVCGCFVAQAQIDIPRASSAGSVSSRIGLVDISIDYFRPKMKGRKIFGNGDKYLLSYGKIWRTGANGGTKITFSDDVKIEGIAVPKGSYLIFSWPGASEWTIALYGDLSISGNIGRYEKSKEVANFKVMPEKIARNVQTFTMQIGDIADDNTAGKIQIAWEKTSVKFAVTTDYDAKVMASIAKGINGEPRNLYAAASYYYENKKDLKQALVWINEYLAAADRANEFFTLNLKANIQKGLGDKSGAMATAQKSLEESRKASNDAYVKLNEELIRSLK